MDLGELGVAGKQLQELGLLSKSGVGRGWTRLSRQHRRAWCHPALSVDSFQVFYLLETSAASFDLL